MSVLLIYLGIILHVKNLDKEINKEILLKNFSFYGKVLFVDIIPGEETRRYGIVSFLSPADAARAVNGLNGRVIILNQLFVYLASSPVKDRRTGNPFTQRFGKFNLVSVIMRNTFVVCLSLFKYLLSNNSAT